MKKTNKPNTPHDQQVNSGVFRRERGHTSLTVRILILCVSLVVLVAAAISIIFMVTIDRYSKQELEAQSRISMQYLNADLQIVLTVNISAVKISFKDFSVFTFLSFLFSVICSFPIPNGV